jgi:hypothetical protein
MGNVVLNSSTPSTEENLEYLNKFWTPEVGHQVRKPDGGYSVVVSFEEEFPDQTHLTDGSLVYIQDCDWFPSVMEAVEHILIGKYKLMLTAQTDQVGRHDGLYDPKRYLAYPAPVTIDEVADVLRRHRTTLMSLTTKNRGDRK